MNMTIVEKSHRNENYCIELTIEFAYGRSYYQVSACPLIDDGTCGSPIREITYSLNDKKNAYATFNRYKRKYI